MIVGLLEGDPSSFLSKEPTWKPEELDTGGKFEMADLIEIAQGARRRLARPTVSAISPEGGRPAARLSGPDAQLAGLRGVDRQLPSTANVLPSGSLNQATFPPPALGEIPFSSVVTSS